MILRTIYLIFLFCLYISVSAQNYNYRHYGVEDGLPSSEIYSAFQDSKGYIWFATDAGVSKYNGNSFTNYEVKDGLTDNTVFLITEDSKGRIWFGTFNGQLSYFFKDSIYSYEHNDKLTKVMLGNSGIQSFYVDAQENVWMGFNLEGIVKCDSNGIVSQMNSIATDVNRTFSFLLVEDHNIWGSTRNRDNPRYFNANSEYLKLAVNFNSDKNGIQIEKKILPEWNNNLALCANGKERLLVLSNSLYRIDKLGNSKEYNISNLFNSNKSRVYAIFCFNGFLWFCMENEGVYKCSIEKGNISVEDRFLPNLSVSRIMQDNNGGIWFQTLKEGVFHLPNTGIKYTDFNDKIIEIEIDTINALIYTSLSGGDLYVKSLSENKFEFLTKHKTASYALSYNYSTSQLYIGGANQFNEYLMNSSFIELSDITPMQVKDFLIEKDFTYRVNGFGLSILKNEKEIYNSYLDGENSIWCTSLVRNKEEIWIGTKDGMRVYSKNKMKNPYSNDPYLSSYISSLSKFKADLLLVGTKSFGVLVYQNNHLLHKIGKAEGLSSNLINSIHVDNDHQIWIGTNKGISRIDYNNGAYQIYNLNKNHGLVSDEISKITSFQNYIYAASPKGLIYFDKTTVKIDEVSPKLYITSLLANNLELELGQNIELAYDLNHISITFEGLNYKVDGEITYNYRLLGVDSNWIKTTTPNVQFLSLSPNEYQFEVRVKNLDGFWSNSKKLCFTVTPPFWLTWWFNFVIFIAIIGLIFLGFKTNLLAYNLHIQKELVNRVLKRLGKQSYVFIEVDKKRIRINEAEILFVQSFKNYVEINTNTKKHLYRSTMSNMEEKLSPLKFTRTHRSFIVQIDKIDSISEDELIVEHNAVPIGKTYKKELNTLKEEFFRLNA